MQDRHQFTPKGITKIRNQAEKLEAQLRNLESQVAESADVGGNQWHDNFSYEQLTQQIRGISHRLNELRATLNQAILAEKPTGTIVAIGTRVTIQIGTNDPEDWLIAGYGESDPDLNVLAYNTPLAQLLLGKTSGSKAEGMLGNKNTLIEIQKITIDESL